MSDVGAKIRDLACSLAVVLRDLAGARQVNGELERFLGPTCGASAVVFGAARRWPPRAWGPRAPSRGLRNRLLSLTGMDARLGQRGVGRRGPPRHAGGFWWAPEHEEVRQ